MYRQEEPEVNLQQIVDRIRAAFARLRIGGGGGRGVYLVFAIFAVALAAWLGSGIFTVQPGEQAALRMLGKFVAVREAGLHWFWPAPIGTRAVVNVEKVQRLEVGLRGNTPVLVESLMITGDENLVDVQLVVQYDIQRTLTDENGTVVSAIELYLFRAVDPDGIILKSATESALRQVVGQRDIDDVLTVLKEEVQAETKALLQRMLDSYETGIRVREVKLQNVQAPTQVQDAFDDVVRAKEDKQKTIRLAEAYEADVLPRARGEAAKVLEAAKAFKEERKAKATGEASRFLDVFREYEKSPAVTRERLYLEAMEALLPAVRIFVVGADTGGNLLQLLPLTDNIPGGASAPAGAP